MLYLVKHNFTGKLYIATKGTEFSQTWFSCRPNGEFYDLGPNIAFSPNEVTIVKFLN